MAAGPQERRTSPKESDVSSRAESADLRLLVVEYCRRTVQRRISFARG